MWEWVGAEDLPERLERLLALVWRIAFAAGRNHVRVSYGLYPNVTKELRAAIKEELIDE